MYNKLECPRGHASWICTRQSLYGVRLQLINVPVFVRRFGWLMLDGISESAENMGRAFSNMNIKEQILDRYLYTF
jgi:hypothetical protein